MTQIIYLVKILEKNNIGKTILVVGHSNTTPVLANKIIGKDIYSSIDERIHGYLFFYTNNGKNNLPFTKLGMIKMINKI